MGSVPLEELRAWQHRLDNVSADYLPTYLPCLPKVPNFRYYLHAAPGHSH